nr:NAD(P)/FAD-dependent oxidoreductase [uncultured Flavobacterium sp.]
MLLHNKNIAIIGAGPVGLTMARLLQQQGVNVTVYERDANPQARIWGGTLDLHKTSGQLTMKKAGLLERYFELALPMGIHFSDTNGNITATRDITPENRFDNPEINRNALRKMLLDSLKRGTVIWDRKFTNLEFRNGQWHISFENQPDVIADMVIGANGGMSAIRKYITDTETEDTGTFIIQGDIPEPEINCPEFFKRCGGNRLMVANNGSMLVANPHNNGQLSYGVIFKKPDTWTNGNPIDFNDNNAVYNYLCERLTNWGNIYKKLFKSTSFFVGLTTRKLPLGKPWNSNRPLPITLIGDAAHLMPPFAGQGVNTGLMDALVLSENLTNGKFETITAAITAYENEMFMYAGAAQAASSANEQELWQPGFSFRQFIE